METRGESRVLKAKTEVPKNDTKQGAGENKLSPVTNKEMDSSIQSTESTKKKSVISKAKLEMDRKLVESRLALEKAKLEKEAEENIIEGNEESSTQNPKEKCSSLAFLQLAVICEDCVQHRSYAAANTDLILTAGKRKQKRHFYPVVVHDCHGSKPFL
ncbi:hypothetical protein JTB14_027917 [Gonioctena quinquepunctata]|nr:hypothetical protein JTB14_027917 [Gonioctena quinquepunctata]